MRYRSALAQAEILIFVIQITGHVLKSHYADSKVARYRQLSSSPEGALYAFRYCF